MRLRNDTLLLSAYIGVMMKLVSTMTVKELLERYPEARAFFIHRGMLCVGCPTEGLHSIEDVARHYRYTVESFMEALEKTIDPADTVSSDTV